MARNFLRLSKKYLATVTGRDQQIDDLLCTFLSERYRIPRDQKGVIEVRFARDFDLTPSEVSDRVHLFKFAFRVLVGSVSLETLEGTGRSEAEYARYLKADGITTWEEVQKQFSATTAPLPPPEPVATAAPTPTGVLSATHVLVRKEELEGLLRDVDVLQGVMDELAANFEKERASLLDREASLRSSVEVLSQQVKALKPMPVDEMRIAPRPTLSTPAATSILRVSRPVEEERSAPSPQPSAVPAPAPAARPDPTSERSVPPAPRATPSRWAQPVPKPEAPTQNGHVELCGRRFPSTSNFQGKSRSVRWGPRFTDVMEKRLDEPVKLAALDTMDAVIRGSQAPGTPTLGFLDEKRARAYDPRVDARTAKFMGKWLLVFIAEVNGLVFKDVIPELSP